MATCCRFPANVSCDLISHSSCDQLGLWSTDLICTKMSTSAQTQEGLPCRNHGQKPDYEEGIILIRMLKTQQLYNAPASIIITPLSEYQCPYMRIKSQIPLSECHFYKCHPCPKQMGLPDRNKLMQRRGLSNLIGPILIINHNPTIVLTIIIIF